MRVNRHQAAIALGLEAGARVETFATDEDLAAIRQGAGLAVERPPEPAPARRPIGQRRRPTKKAAKASAGKKVFVVHGRNVKLTRDTFSLLRAMRLEPLEWGKALKATKQGAPYVGDVLDEAFKGVGAVLVLLSPDDSAKLNREFWRQDEAEYERKLSGQPRPNVLFEAGLAFGRHPRSTVLAQVGKLRPISDIAGRHVVHLSNHAESRKELANKLEACGCEVDLSGDDWLKVGDFSA